MQIAVELACRLTGLTPRAVGAYDGGIGCAAASVARRKIRARSGPREKIIERLLARLAKETATMR